MTVDRGRDVVHVAPWVVPVSAAPIRDGAVWITGDRIRLVGRAREVLAAAESVPVTEWDGALMPGLINAHTHLQYTCMAEVGQHTYAGFEDWSVAFQKLYDQPGHDWRASAINGVRLAIASGTSAFADIVTNREALGALRDEGAYGVSYWEIMGWLDNAWFNGGSRETENLLLSHGLGGVGLSPHAPYSVDTGVLSDLSALSQRLGVRRHLHLAESKWEDNLTLSGTGNLAQRLLDWGFSEFSLLRNGGTGQRAVPYAGNIGALGADTHIAHGIYVNADDRALLRREGVVVALCPRSNALIGLDEAPVANYLREGNVIAVGTDSLSSSPSLDVLADAAELVRIARYQGYSARDLHGRIADAVTRGGARAMGLAVGDGRLGVLEPGAGANVTVCGVNARTADELLAALTEDGSGKNIATIIDGRVRWTRAMAHTYSSGGQLPAD